jgi:hypothetical protein
VGSRGSVRHDARLSAYLNAEDHPADRRHAIISGGGRCRGKTLVELVLARTLDSVTELEHGQDLDKDRKVDFEAKQRDR